MDDCDSSSDDEPLARLLPQHSPSTTPTKKIGTCKEVASEDSLPVASLLPEQSPPLATTPTTTPRKDKKRLLTPNSKSLPQPSSKRTSADRKEEEKRCSAAMSVVLSCQAVPYSYIRGIFSMEHIAIIINISFLYLIDQVINLIDRFDISTRKLHVNTLYLYLL
ncbi:hypothetical protein Bbelb_283020 [Branchiostoma belcheri]|nr:hypothetical protein Bbelb_283020 [Branchiostoma belcheri]